MTKRLILIQYIRISIIDLNRLLFSNINLRFQSTRMINQILKSSIIMNKTTFGLLFLVISAGILLTLSYFDLLEQYIGFSLIPILGAYQLGQYSERKFKNDKIDDK